MDFTENFSKVKVLIVGDVMLDRYWWGKSSRISPEAPVPIVNLERVSATVGGAANVAANVAGLGAEPFLIGVVGDDAEADFFIEQLDEKNVSTKFLLKSSERQTTVKTRIIAHNQQVARIDLEKNENLSSSDEKKVLARVFDLIDLADILIISDYAKGVVTKNLLTRLITTCQAKGKFVLVDPKGKNYARYCGATLLTPNRSEIREACNLESTDQSAIEAAGEKLVSELSLEYLLITQGEDGMTLFKKDAPKTHLTVEARNVYDVTGAGDTVIACLAVAVGSGADFLEAAKFANRAAGLVVGQVGTTAISMEMLNQQLPID